MTSTKWAWRLMVPAIVIAASLTATASGSAANSASSTINISDEYGVTWNCQFNPYNASDEFDSFGPVYEELVYIEHR